MSQDAKDAYSPLMLAARNGHAKCVRVLLDKDADVTVVSREDGYKHGFNPLMESIEEGHK